MFFISLMNLKWCDKSGEVQQDKGVQKTDGSGLLPMKSIRYSLKI